MQHCSITELAPLLDKDKDEASVGTLKINVYCVNVVPLRCVREVGDADDAEKNQQTIVSFFWSPPPCQISPPSVQACNVSPLWGEKPQSASE